MQCFRGTVILAMAISDWKVVGSYIGETKEDALWGLYTLLYVLFVLFHSISKFRKDKRKPNEKYKFVVNCHYKDGYSDVFTPFYRGEFFYIFVCCLFDIFVCCLLDIFVYSDGYEHNEKVIIWIKKNFIFVHYPQYVYISIELCNFYIQSTVHANRCNVQLLFVVLLKEWIFCI